MKSIYTALLLLLSLSVQAQHKPYNRAFLSYGQQYYFNKSYVLNDDKEPNPLRPHNTYGYNGSGFLGWLGITSRHTLYTWDDPHLPPTELTFLTEAGQC